MSRDVTLIEAPYHLGVEGLAAGAGPRTLLDAGADNAAGRRGRPAQVQHVRMWDARSRGLDAIVDVNRLIARAVREAVEQESLPLVLAGNCNSCLGTLSGLGGEGTGIVWFDAHGDFNTPATSVSGALEGMALAAAVGLCHDELRVRTALHEPVAGRDVVVLGAWDLDPGEADRLAAEQVTVRPPDRLDDVHDLLVALRLRVQRVYLHFDVDVLNAPNGISVHQAAALLQQVMATVPVAAAAVTNYNPQMDDSGERAREILSLLPRFAE